MSLLAPSKAPIRNFIDIYGNLVYAGNGQPTLISFFRDSVCPFCHFRLYELTMHYQELSKQGLQIIVVFAAEQEDIQKFVTKQQRPFSLIADADMSLHHQYEVQSRRLVGMEKMKMMLQNFYKMMKGMMLVGPGNAMASTSTVLPADFLIDRDGTISETFYSDDYAERMPIENIFSFATQEAIKDRRQRAYQSERLSRFASN